MKKKLSQDVTAIILSLFVISIIIIVVIMWTSILYYRAEGYPDEEVFDILPMIVLDMIIILLFYMMIVFFWRLYYLSKPLSSVEKSLKGISSGDFNEKINVSSISSNFKNIAESINKISSELAEVDTFKSDFVSNVSHEIRTPLAVINNYSTLLKAQTVSNKERIEYAQTIGRASDRLGSMITNIFKLNMLEVNHLDPKNDLFDLGANVSECLLGFENVWESKNINIDVDIEDDVMVKSDMELLSLIWNNLFSNAFKFTPEGGAVTVSVKQDNDYAYVSVKDTGCGIKPDTGKRIFDKFFQQDTSHSSLGNGLGLALVRRIIDMISGQITVQSKVGVGSVFTVKISKKGRW